MKVDVWLDVRCPNCYIGKKRFEDALRQFEFRDEVRINYHSFELSPTLKAMPGKSVFEYLAELKGKSIEWSHEVYKQVAQTAADIGLLYNFDKTIIANSFDAHRVFQFAKTLNLQSEVLDRLYYAYFTEGLDISSFDNLTLCAVSVGLPELEVREVLRTGAYATDVRDDEARAESIIITGVPFFLINNKLGMSGNQSTDIYLHSIKEAWEQYEKLRLDPTYNADEDDDCEKFGFC